MLFLKHPAWLWLKKYAKGKLPPIDENTQSMFDTGHEFEAYAEKLLPDPVRLGFNNYDEYASLPLQTKQEIEKGTPIILQGRLEVGGITCIFDVLKRIEEGLFDLIEIKSSTKAKPEHEYDLAFQTIVLQKAGLKVRNVSVMHVNNTYIRNGDIEIEKLVATTDVTDAVHNLLSVTEEQIQKAFAVLSTRTMPDLSPRHVNRLGIKNVDWLKDWLEVYKLLKPDLDPYCIYFLSCPSPEQIGKLEDAGIKTIADIPNELALRPKQAMQIKTTREDKQVVEIDKIRQFLDTFEYPLYFFDYETFMSAIPYFDGCSPYKQYPFQYSLHILEYPGATLKHTEYLHTENTNPMPELIEHLIEDLGNTGTILTWNMKFEKGCNKTMGELFPQYQQKLHAINDRIQDLMTPFASMWFFDKNFFGSASIKKVLPALIPELSYKDLDIGDGQHAQRIWMETVLKGQNGDRKEEILSQLSTYCTLDTMAMVKIYEALEAIAPQLLKVVIPKPIQPQILVQPNSPTEPISPL